MHIQHSSASLQWPYDDSLPVVSNQSQHGCRGAFGCDEPSGRASRSAYLCLLPYSHEPGALHFKSASTRTAGKDDMNLRIVLTDLSSHRISNNYLTLAPISHPQACAKTNGDHSGLFIYQTRPRDERKACTPSKSFENGASSTRLAGSFQTLSHVLIRRRKLKK